MQPEKVNGVARAAKRPVKQMVLVLAAVLSGYGTSNEVASVCGLSLAMAARRLLDLEGSGHIERIGTLARGGAGTRGGGGAIRWRIKEHV